ncbi:SH3 domain-containing protein [Clostridium tagluense]|uniref:SH3 domain-containing protein n=1 Tax=Clostridium tagluense TaxID=360422 RepID=UPI001C0E8DC7|nr:SH3 domain-containing protein [Clostridium tagluense]MBU3130017.1 SH3 domain-containing protein [Clostridium tagluense]MCB2311864.1 SH3 domain-containing protein [Clostridium tagluense]MCB2317381.1 SH3 domain-containing protein [Clostridium tagluense]MCB2322825.1 SH3 domain-containing protein [Clostridium tagluense]MCB2326935.1 SH3 domain-containing protein [Clostridium tagluense]
MNKKIKNCLALLLVTGTLLTSNAPVFASEVVSPVKNEQAEKQISANFTQRSASWSYTGYIYGDDVRIRRTPNDANNTNVIDLLKSGTHLRFLHSDTPDWCKIQLENGIIGYVAARFVQQL